MKSVHRKPTMGVHEQAAFMRLQCPTFRTSIREGTLRAVGHLQPDPLCRVYEVQIEYSATNAPEVRVLSPNLKTRDDEFIPHMYGQEKLCLYLPETGEWSPDLPLATTIVPWTALWLYFYEVWHATGQWLGGGIEPEDRRPYRRGDDDAEQ